ncbi:Sugar and other transporter [Aspergillus parasiticus SU-1]|uniref:Sugar and other transporter n=1 Tax=Aspergillus parasiticus (strain ATCC 56775 / NRRL 5862 / SRRC 143 / SU-1) TaxID=1403190 RepID=A0A0F0I5L3_ASPPU|nr:Sugar and other transporter [Aspergillus parasiticus SU-1]
MSSPAENEKNSEILFPSSEHIQNSSNPSPHAALNGGACIHYERDRASSGGKFFKNFGWMGDLPEWKIGNEKLKGRALNWSIGFIASCGFLMFGYDQGVLSALLTLDSFQEVLPLMTPRDKSNDLCWLDNPTNTIPHPTYCTGDANTQAAGVAIYQIGCWMGSLVILAYGERWGRKSSTFWGSLIMIIGTIMQAACFDYGLFVAGRVVGGIGNGMVTSSEYFFKVSSTYNDPDQVAIPTWQSECARPHQRGVLIMLSGALISAGVMIAYWVDYGFYFLTGSVRWRFPLMFQSFFTIIVMIGLLYLPDSPRWLTMQGRHAEARDVTARLVGKAEDHPEVEEELRNINEALEVQSRGGSFKYRELLTNGPSQNLRRSTLAMVSQFFQQMCGINLVTYYATVIFENSLGFGPEMARLLAACNGTEYFMASLIALPLIERTGRRKLMIIGAFGMMVSMAILAGTVSTGEIMENGAPRLETQYGVTATVFLFVFNSFFAIGWLGMTWLYPAEITNLRIRIQANALSTSSNWMSNFLIVMITPPAFANLGYQTYIIFAVFNAALIPCVYLFFPETKGRTLEELDVVFASANAQGISPVKQSLQMPKLAGDSLDRELARYFGTSSDEETSREK